jgi:hypothetical protein
VHVPGKKKREGKVWLCCVKQVKSEGGGAGKSNTTRAHKKGIVGEQGEWYVLYCEPTHP